MTELDCAKVRDVAAELALGVLPARDRARAVLHLQDCPACQQHIRELTAVGDRLVALVPGAEPPVGFEQRVLERVGLAGRDHRRQWRWRWLAAALAAVVVVVGFSLMNWAPRRGTVEEVTSAPVSIGNATVGKVFAYTDHRPWMYVEVHQLPTSGSMACQLRLADGTVFTAGSFLVSGGAGLWAGPVPIYHADVAEVRILDPNGSVVATAQFD
jgi:hypothetical protein